MDFSCKKCRKLLWRRHAGSWLLRGGGVVINNCRKPFLWIEYETSVPAGGGGGNEEISMGPMQNEGMQCLFQLPLTYCPHYATLVKPVHWRDSFPFSKEEFLTHSRRTRPSGRRASSTTQWPSPSHWPIFLPWSETQPSDLSSKWVPLSLFPHFLLLPCLTSQQSLELYVKETVQKVLHWGLRNQSSNKSNNGFLM